MKKTNKKKTTSSNLLVEKCAVCGRKTPHYVSANGEVRCAICQNVARTVAVKDVGFEVDPEFDNELNPVSAEEPEPIVGELP